VGHHNHFVFNQKLLDAQGCVGLRRFQKKNRQTHLQSLRKKYQKNQHEARSVMSLGRLDQNIVGSPYLVAEP
jgi:hypothetical protein